MGAASKTLYFGVTTVFIAYLYMRWHPEELNGLDAIEKKVTEVWEKQIKYPSVPSTRLAVG